MESKAKEEAERIIFDYQFCDASLEFNDGIMTKKLAVICAIIHVDGIIDNIDSMEWGLLTDVSIKSADERREFWQEVKQELNKKL